MKTLIAVVLLGITVPSFADDNAGDTGNELITYCNDADAQKSDGNFRACILLVQGILSGYQAAVLSTVAKLSTPPLSSDQLLAKGNAVLGFCQPEHATRYQDALVVTKYLKDHPEQLTDWSPLLVIDAFTTAWPCSKK